MTQHIPLEQLAIEPMHVGWECLRLTERIGWDDFPAYAKSLSDQLQAQLLDEIDGPDVRIWHVLIGGLPFSIVYDDYPVGVSLEPRTEEASARIPALRAQLEASLG